MSWIDNVLPPKIRSFLGNTKRETPENLWVKDPESGEMVFYRDLEANQWVVPNSGYHMKIRPPTGCTASSTPATTTLWRCRACRPIR